MKAELERRVAAAQATLDTFRTRPFKLGKNDCLSLALYHLERGGVGVRLGVRPYKTVAQAKAELKRLRAAHVGELFDAHFERIPYLSVIVGDLVAMKGLKGMGGLSVALGNGRVVGYHEAIADNTADVLQPIETLGAWRVPF